MFRRGNSVSTVDVPSLSVEYTKDGIELSKQEPKIVFFLVKNGRKIWHNPKNKIA